MGSVRRRGGKVRIELDAAELALLGSLAGQVRQLLTEGLPEGLADGGLDPLQALIGLRSRPTDAPDDPILARLLPAAYRDDDEAAAAFRSLMDADLRLQKAAALQRMIDDLAAGLPHGDVSRIELADDAAAQWLYALTDLRLALGTSLDVTEDLDARELARDADSPQAVGFAIYDWLSWLQETMVGALPI